MSKFEAEEGDNVKAMSGKWQDSSPTSGTKFDCGFCGSIAGPSRKYECSYIESGRVGQKRVPGSIFVCPSCNKPTFFHAGEQVPGIKLGNELKYLPEKVESLYEEARTCFSVNAFTSVTLCCRKLLMNTAVSKEADEDKKFAYYVQYLKDNHYVPPGGESWVDHIRKKGNTATHEIDEMSKEDAEEILSFTEMLLRFVYEMPGKMQKHLNQTAPK